MQHHVRAGPAGLEPERRRSRPGYSDSWQAIKKLEPVIAAINATMESDLFSNVPAIIADPSAAKLGDLQDLERIASAIVAGSSSEDLPDLKEIGSIVQAASKTNSVADQMIKPIQKM